MLCTGLPVAEYGGLPLADVAERVALGCAYRYYRGWGIAGEGGVRSVGGCSPDEEPGFYCTQTAQACTPTPPDCLRWKPSPLVCPACLTFRERRYPKSLFLEAHLVESVGCYCCPECFEVYDSLMDVALRALAVLRDALDDCNYAEGLAQADEDAEAGGEGIPLQ